jgi:tripartite-type tricarboxylate transporter receptor subunit TctC
MSNPVARSTLAVAALTAFLFAQAIHAEPFPSKPVVKLIVPSPAGSPPDVNARKLAEKVSAWLGRAVIVENKPGAGGAIAMEAAARSEPDGHTLVFTTSAVLTVNPSVYEHLQYDPVKDFAPVVLAYRVPLLLVVNPSLTAKSLRELVDAAKATPGKLFYGSAGNGTPPHLFSELFKFRAGVDLVHVPYKGGPAATVALLAGDVAVGLDVPSQLLPHVRAGKLRALAVTGERRLASLPDVPTFSEAGLTGMGTTWSGVVAPVGTSRDIIREVNRAFCEALASPDIQAYFAEFDITSIASTPEEMQAAIAQEIPLWRDVVKKAGIKAD